jgi:glycosyltransferase involved in cell wall biosynthesis
MAGPSPRSRRRITLVSDELAGLQGGGLGTATAFLGVALARMGHRVEVLYVGVEPGRRIDPEWRRLYDESGLQVRLLSNRGGRIDPPHFARMRRIDETLSADPPDVVITQDLAAPAYTALRLKQLGLALEDTLFVVYCHGTRQWIADMARKVRVLPGALAVSVLEEASIALADVAVSPSAYMLEWMERQGWALPPTTVVIPLLTRTAVTDEQKQHVTQNGPIRRIAFFGRLEERKGVRPFVAGLNALEPRLLEEVELEFLGPPTPAWPPARVEALLSDRTRNLVSSVSFATELGQREALARLARPGTLAVMPSLEDNSPSTVYECLEHGIPFLASDAGGTAELIAPEDRERVLFAPTASGVEQALERTLTGNGFRPARPAFDVDRALAQWEDVIAKRPAKREVADAPRPVEVVATNHFARVAETNADWIVLVDEDDEPRDGWLETLTRAQAASGADIVTCGIEVGGIQHYFPGDPGGLAVLSNGYGTVALIRRSLLVNHMTSRTAQGDEAWPLLARLVAAGARIVSVPLPLVTRRRAPGTLERHPADAFLVVRELERGAHRPLRSIARLAAGLAADLHSAQPLPQRRVRRLARRLLTRS